MLPLFWMIRLCCDNWMFSKRRGCLLARFLRMEYLFNRANNISRYPTPSDLLTCFLGRFLRVPSPATMIIGDCDVTQCIVHWSTLDINFYWFHYILWYFRIYNRCLVLLHFFFWNFLCLCAVCLSVPETERSSRGTAGTACRCVFGESSLPDHGRRSVYWKLVPRLKQEGNLTKRTCDQLSAVIIN